MRNTIDKNMVYVTHDQIEAMTLGDRIVVMSEGVIQQQGSPEDLFKSPANRFVAGFIGSPTMNFLTAEIQTNGKGVSAVGDGFSVPMDAELGSRLQAHSDKSITLGIRPSSLTRDMKAGPSIALRLVVSEYLGAQSTLVTRCGEEEVLVELDSSSPIRAEGMMDFAVRTDEVMAFDIQSGARI